MIACESSGFAVSAGIGPSCQGWDDFPAAATAALEALARRWYRGTGRVIHATDEAPQDGSPFPGSASLDATPIEASTIEANTIVPAFLDLLRSGDGQGALKMLETMAGYLRSRGDPAADRSFIADLPGLILSVHDSGQPHAGNGPQRLEKIRSAKDAVQRASTLESAMVVVAVAVREVSALADRSNATPGALIASRALEFMVVNFARPIGVDDVALAVSKHPKHLCRVVKEETGSTVMDHLLAIRMRKSLELLSDATLAIADVARGVGIPDAQYFARLFRKTYGITPSEHRASGELPLMLPISTKPLPPSIHGSENP
jgi:two-component system response regulator YesN